MLSKPEIARLSGFDIRNSTATMVCFPIWYSNLGAMFASGSSANRQCDALSHPHHTPPASRDEYDCFWWLNDYNSFER